MRSLKRALLAYILTGVALAVVAAGLAVAVVSSGNLRAQLDDTLRDRANTLGSLVSEEDDGSLELEYDQPLDEANVGVLARLTADDGTIIAQSPDWPAGAGAPALTPEGEPILRTLRLTGEAERRCVALAKHASRERSASTGGLATTSERFVVVEVMGRMDSVRRAESAVVVALAAGGLLAVLGSAVAVWFGIRRGLHPLRQLGSAVAGIDTRRPVWPTQDGRYPEELRPITSALEELLGRVRAAMERERRFTDAAAHELRTPIAELKTITDVTDRWPDPERLHRGVKDARVVVRQMEDLLDSLLAAARDSTADTTQTIEAVELIPLARHVAEEATARLRRRDLSWSFEGDGASWTGPRGTILAIVRNLIDNAAEYTQEDGRVEIRAKANGDSTALEMENGPVSLEPSEVVHLLEPFWRADPSRSDREHRGLGLSIVDSLAKTIGVRLDSTITPGHRLRIRLVSTSSSP